VAQAAAASWTPDAHGGPDGGGPDGGGPDGGQSDDDPNGAHR
jgi:hypothetical protein